MVAAAAGRFYAATRAAGANHFSFTPSGQCPRCSPAFLTICPPRSLRATERAVLREPWQYSGHGPAVVFLDNAPTYLASWPWLRSGMAAEVVGCPPHPRRDQPGRFMGRTYIGQRPTSLCARSRRASREMPGSPAHALQRGGLPVFVLVTWVFLAVLSSGAVVAPRTPSRSREWIALALPLYRPTIFSA